MTNKEITLGFAHVLLTLSEDPRGFEKYCKRVAQKRWTQNNPEKKKASDAAYYRANTEKVQATQKRYNEANPDIARACKRRYYDRNVDVCKQRARAHRKSPKGRAWLNNWSKQKRIADPSWRLEQNTRSRIYDALFLQGLKKEKGALEILGVASRQEFFDFIAAKLPKEFSWDNYGTEWELDHIRPCASFDLSDPEQLRQCFHHSNYQPLSVFDNRSKGAKWNNA